MQVIQIGKSEFRLNRFPTDVKGGKVKYFVRGKGYKTTKAFKILEEELPDVWGQSWLRICQLYEKWGIEVAKEYAEGRVAGIVARDFARAKFAMYERIKELIPTEEEEFKKFEAFFETLPHDYLLGCFGVGMFDVISFDEFLASQDEEYDAEECTYKGETCSMRGYVTQKFGPFYAEVIEKLL